MPEKRRRASLFQVAATIFWALFAIGKENTWQKNAAAVTPGQIVAGAVVGAVVIIGLLVLLVRFVTR
jgi:hypothetical protein